MTKIELENALSSNLFASRETLNDAYEYALAIAKSCGNDGPYVLTALHVMMNTIAKELKKISD